MMKEKKPSFSYCCSR